MTSQRDFRPRYENPPIEVVAQPHDESTLVVDIHGELDLATGPILKESLRSAAAQVRGDSRHRDVVYRLSGLEFIDACGLHALLTAWDGADRITIEEPSRAVRRLLSLVGLDSMIQDRRPTFR